MDPRCRRRSRHHPRHQRGLRRHRLQQRICPWPNLPLWFPEMLRVVRPGGYILIAMKDGYNSQSTRFAMMDTDIQDLVRTRKAELTIGPVVFKHFMLNNDGRFYMLRKPLSHTWAVGSPHNSPATRRRNM